MNNLLILRDNTPGQELEPQAFKGLETFSGKKLPDLCNEHPGLLVFPHSLNQTLDRLDDMDSPVLSHYMRNVGGEEKVVVSTSNVMGFISYGGKRLKISSRFDQSEQDMLLHYMLQRTLNLNVFDMGHSRTYDDVLDLLLLLFPRYLRQAMSQGVYREYRTFRHNDANVKGSIDINRHIRSNIPFRGNVAYNTRQYSHDNSVTQLIRHTIEYLRTKDIGNSVLAINKDTMDDVAAICSATPTYNRFARNSVISQNLKAASHPYYTDYLPLQQLCLQILRMEELMYGDNDDEVFGILFDGSWLWEEYIATIICESGYTHSDNKNKKYGCYLFTDCSGIIYPDYYNDVCVLDAKYKKYDEESKACREDRFQIISYMHVLNVQKGGFIYPSTDADKEAKHKPKTLKGLGGKVWLYGLSIPQACEDFGSFVREISLSEKRLKMQVNDMEQNTTFDN